MKKLRIYLDASVLGGCLDEEFSLASCALLDLARGGQAVLLISDVMAGELKNAPAPVRELLTLLPPAATENILTGEEARTLQQAYLDMGVLGPQHDLDALHVALATVARADVITSWNFKHIVHHDRIRGFNAVNHRLGYPLIGIHSPPEVV